VFLAERRPFLVRALIQDERGWVFAGTEADGMFASFDGGKDWQEANDGLTAERVFSFGTDSHGRIVAGTSAGVFRALEVE
jgi:ligand-binding sensor domain-containing protein